jgi:acetylornithine deacetylase/succinyl-diaminopimelate desuccinylase-like protein
MADPLDTQQDEADDETDNSAEAFILLSQQFADREFTASDVTQLVNGMTDTSGQLVNALAKAGCTEAGIYAAAGLEPIVIGPGPSTGVIHAPTEYTFLSDVEAAVRFYRALLEM